MKYYALLNEDGSITEYYPELPLTGEKVPIEKNLWEAYCRALEEMGKGIVICEDEDDDD